MPPYRANLGGAFGSGLQQRPIGGIDISSAVNAIGNQASSLLQGAYLRKIADQERKTREQEMAAAEEERRIARAEKMEADRIARFTAQLQQEKLLSEMGYVPEGATQSMAGMQAQGPTGLPVPTGAIVDATRYGEERITPDGRRFRLDRLSTPEARRIREAQERERIREEARSQRIADREDEQAFRADQSERARAAADVRSTQAADNRPPRAPTEAQEKSALFYGLMSRATRDMNELSTAGRIRPLAIRAALGLWGGNYILNDTEQAYMKAARDFAAGVLRKESGAAIKDDEIRDVFARYIDMPGDSPATLQRKAESRNQYMVLMKKSALPAIRYYEEVERRGAMRDDRPDPDYGGARPPFDPNDPDD